MVSLTHNLYKHLIWYSQLSEPKTKKVPMLPKKSNTTGRCSVQSDYNNATRGSRAISLPIKLENFSNESSSSDEDKDTEISHTYENTLSEVVLETSTSEENYMQPSHSDIPTSINIAYRGNSLTNEACQLQQTSFSADNVDAVSHSDDTSNIPIHSYAEPHTFWNY